MNDETKYCDHCGAKIVEYWHKITPGLVKALIKARELVYLKDVYKGDLPYFENINTIERETHEPIEEPRLIFRRYEAKFTGRAFGLQTNEVYIIKVSPLQFGKAVTVQIVGVSDTARAYKDMHEFGRNWSILKEVTE